MDFCVRCGVKDVYQEYLCKTCYNFLNPPKPQKGARKTQHVVQKTVHHGGYFEAVVQLRNVDEKIYQFVLDLIEENNIHIGKKEYLNHGVDIYLGDKKFAQRLGTLIQDKFGGLLKKTAKIFTRDQLTFKDVYRVTVLFKQFPYSVGETFTFKGKTYTVLSLGKDVVAKDAESKTKKRFLFKTLEHARVF